MNALLVPFTVVGGSEAFCAGTRRKPAVVYFQMFLSMFPKNCKNGMRFCGSDHTLVALESLRCIGILHSNSDSRFPLVYRRSMTRDGH